MLKSIALKHHVFPVAQFAPFVDAFAGVKAMDAPRA
jgi:hypothetical protein